MEKSTTPLLMMLIVLSAAMLLPSGLSQEQCWSSLTGVPSCVTEIIAPLLVGQIGQIGHVCCSAINQITDSCWPKMFPFTPFFAPLLKNFCISTPPQTAGQNAAASKVTLPNLSTPEINVTEVTDCWSSITSTEGCALEVYNSLTSGQITGIGIGIGPVCCKAVTQIHDKCWLKMFPFNPFFPPLLKNNCAMVIGAAPTIV